MSTQHPDNATVPEWAKGDVIEGEAEVIEAYYAFSRLNVHEVMWDAEGKDVDTHVVRKLFSSFDEYFKSNILGEDIFLTYRLPNPKIEGQRGRFSQRPWRAYPLPLTLPRDFTARK